MHETDLCVGISYVVVKPLFSVSNSRHLEGTGRREDKAGA